MSQISLTASMRSNLLSLQGTASLMDQTQERLSSGKKVNSAIDNPSSYYTAQSLTNRANDLSGLLDNMGQAISTIKAANEGIEAITSFVEQAKAVATSALDTTDTSSRIEYGKQLQSIVKQIDALAKDSGYKGINLLQGNELTVTFNEGRTNKLEINGVYADATNLGIRATSINFANTEAEALAKAEDALVKSTEGKSEGTGTFTEVDVTFTDATNTGTVSAALHKDDVFIHDGSMYRVKKANSGDPAVAFASGTAWSVINTTDNIERVAKVGDKYYTDSAVVAKDDDVVAAQKLYDTAVAGLPDTIQNAIDDTTKAVDKLREYASAFGNNYSIVQTREEFTTNLINVLEEGADKLTLADMNEESANMLALQTRQQLAINSLSLASQAAQSVLRLFS